MSFLEMLNLIFTEYQLELITSIISGISCALIGCFIILRGMALIGDALAHAILPGVVIAFMIAGVNPFGLFLGAMVAGIVTSLSISFLQAHSRIKSDSSIGIAFTFFFALGIILSSQIPKSHFDLQCFLFGDPLAARIGDFKMMLGVGLLVCLAIILFYRPLFATSFDPIMAKCMGIKVEWVHYLLMALLSATVVASLQTVGVIMVVAMLITPGAIAYQLTDRLPIMLALSVFFGALSAIAGFILAFWMNWPTGPCMTIIAGTLFFLTMLFSPKYGILFNLYRRWTTQRHILEEDILKSVVRHYPNPLSRKEVEKHLGISHSRFNRIVQRLCKKNMLCLQGENLVLQEAGKALAEEILRTHRLWERYLVEGGMPAEQVHNLAETLEHAHEMADRLSQNLGSPETDPHGQKIPKKPKS